MNMCAGCHDPVSNSDCPVSGARTIWWRHNWKLCHDCRRVRLHYLRDLTTPSSDLFRLIAILVDCRRRCDSAFVSRRHCRCELGIRRHNVCSDVCCLLMSITWVRMLESRLNVLIVVPWIYSVSCIRVSVLQCRKFDCVISLQFLWDNPVPFTIIYLQWNEYTESKWTVTRSTFAGHTSYTIDPLPQNVKNIVCQTWKKSLRKKTVATVWWQVKL